MKYGSIVVTFNRKKLLVEALNSLLNQTVPPTKIILIDNHSDDGTKRMLEQQHLLHHPLIEYRYLSQNIGGAGGFSLGMKIAMSKPGLDWVSMSDDDAIFCPDYFEKLIRFHEQYPDRLILTGSVYIEDGRLQDDQRNRFLSWNNFRTVEVPVSEYQGNFEFDQYTFCGVFMSITVIRMVGIADAGFFIWWDDCEYAIRTAKISKPVNISSARLIHKTALPSIDSKKEFIPDWRMYYGFRNRIITIQRWSQNRFLGLLWLIAFYGRFLIELCGSFYKGHRKMAIQSYWEALRDAIQEKEGLNRNFMPGQKFKD
ncbi:glycosyltransferase family 2 protein [Lactiplantibacillus carotarum]|uniref:glycosyltransferase family 2 protein n=1 Tax=Lactiplantibacillus carotarum TaxID=2993456 RepID=UPI00298EDBB0|nr:glycosyltransferase family 2 protein [Lactiplantibacillus carotarum]